MFQLYASEQSDCYESVLLGSIDQQHFAKTQGNQNRYVNEAVHMRQEKNSTCVVLLAINDTVPIPSLPHIHILQNQLRLRHHFVAHYNGNETKKAM